MVLMASYSAFGGGSIGNMLAQWEAAGVFTYALPFLLIFAIVYAVLSTTKVFKDNKPVNAVVALAVALLALKFQLVPLFFGEIFPRMGIALSILLVVIILVGIFSDPTNPDSKWVNKLFIGITLLVLAIVIFSSLSGFGFGGGWGGFGFLYGINWAGVIFAVLIIGLIVWVIAKGNKGSGQ